MGILSSFCKTKQNKRALAHSSHVIETQKPQKIMDSSVIFSRLNSEYVVTESIKAEEWYFLNNSKYCSTIVTFYPMQSRDGAKLTLSFISSLLWIESNNNLSNEGAFARLFSLAAQTIELSLQRSHVNDCLVFAPNFEIEPGFTSLDAISPGQVIMFDYERERIVGKELKFQTKRHYVKVIEIDEDYFIGQAGDDVKTFRRSRVDNSRETMVKVVYAAEVNTPITLRVEVSPNSSLDGYEIIFSRLEKK